MGEKVIALIDMDCFYVQVEARENPAIRGVPAAVVQYKAWKGGGIIAVNYEARAKGVSRQMRGDEAREKCPDIVLVRVPEVREKADLTKYRKAGREVIEVLVSFGAIVERASIDEAYLDLTPLVESRLKEPGFKETVLDDLPNTHLGGSDEEREAGLSAWLNDMRSSELSADLRLAVGASIVEQMREAVYAKTQFRCSAGVAHCKTLAKLCCGLNKPNKQTVLPHSAVPSLYSTLRVTKVRGLGGKLGEAVTVSLGIQTMGQLAEFSLKQLCDQFDEKTGTWLHGLAKGYDGESVSERELPKSIGCGKNFRGPDILDTKAKVELRLGNLVEELVERLEVDREENSRIARGVTVGTNLENQGYVSRAGQLQSYNQDNVYRTVYGLLSKLNTADVSGPGWEPKLLNISLSAGKFEDLKSTIGNTQAITSFFKKSTRASTSTADMSRNADTSSFLDQSSLLTQLDHSSDNAKVLSEDSVISATQNASLKSPNMETQATNIFKSLQSIKSKGAQTNGASASRTPKPSPTVSPASQSSRMMSFFQRKMRQMKEEENQEDGGGIDKTKNKMATSDNLYGSVIDAGQVELEDDKVAEDENYETASVIKTESLEKASGNKGEITEEGVERQDGVVEDGKRVNIDESGDTINRTSEKMEASRFEDGKNNFNASHVFVEEGLSTRDGETSDRSDGKAPGNDVNVVAPSDGGEEATVVEGDEVNMSELIPSLEEFDSEILEFLPHKVRLRALDRLEFLKSNKPTTGQAEANTQKVPRLVDKNSSVTCSTDAKPSTCGAVASKDKREDTEDLEDMVLCSKCNKMISAFELPEHLDYHVAKELREEQILADRSAIINSTKKAKSSSTTAASSARGGNRKRQRPSETGDTTAKHKKHKDISSFFTRR